MCAKWQAHVAKVRANAKVRTDRIDEHALATDADMGEDYALDAIDVAQAAIDVAKSAVLDATCLRAGPTVLRSQA